LKNKPNDPRTLPVLAQVDANLGNKELALNEAQKLSLLCGVKGRIRWTAGLQGLAQVYTWTGDHDRALDQLQTLLGMPGYISYGYLKTDPAGSRYGSTRAFNNSSRRWFPRNRTPDSNA